MPRPTIIDAEGLLTPAALKHFAAMPGSVILESTKPDRAHARTWVFHRPEYTIECRSAAEVEGTLKAAERALQDGCYIAGYLSYEAGAAFEPGSPECQAETLPMVWFGVYRDPAIYRHDIRRWHRPPEIPQFLRSDVQQTSVAGPIHHDRVIPHVDRETYLMHARRIIDYLAAGDSYQVNYTFPLLCTFQEPPADVYVRLRRSQRVPYSSFLTMEHGSILSFSPELFFRLQDGRLTLRPMKGTAPRGRYPAEDRVRMIQLRDSEKDRAENLMIVDLLRNDAGKVAIPGSVIVKTFFAVEQYETVFQATSTIEARVQPHVGLLDLVRALFPCGSVTGAPKRRTMQIIRELEPFLRGVYTGAIGYMGPDGNGEMNVAIRTVVMDGPNGRGTMSVGSGITIASSPEQEYEECILKSRFLTAETPAFKLFETIRWDPVGGWWLLPLHMRRLKQAAGYFEIPWDAKRVQRLLAETDRSLRAKAGKRVRRKSAPRSPAPDMVRVKLLLDRMGGCATACRLLDPVPEVIRIGFWHMPVDRRDRFLYFKTTHRPLYDVAGGMANDRGWFDVLFLNERGEVTEGTRTNVFVKREGTLLTPPVDCGLLDGTFKAHLLRSRTWRVRESVLRRVDIEHAEELYVANALRGLVRVHRVERETLKGP